MANEYPTKLCECGCGLAAPVSTYSYAAAGRLKGQPIRFIKGHNGARHRMTGTKTYNSWMAMKARCTKKYNNEFHRYGAAGVTVCERWLVFGNFLADMGQRPAGKSLDRIDNSIGYEPSNCRWATPSEQNDNRRRTIRITFNESTRTLTEWSKILGIKYDTLHQRLSLKKEVPPFLFRPAGPSRRG